MVLRRLGASDLSVFPLCLGGNVFGWTADAHASEAVLDAYAAAGGNFIDTADVYSAWAPGHVGGESETLIGQWMRARGNRTRMVVATKVAKLPGLEGLAPATIHTAVEGSLRRLGTDYIDLYYAHHDDTAVPLEDTLRAFDTLVRTGKVRYIAASNYGAPRLAEALEISRRHGLASYVAVQPQHNLMHRQDYTGPLRAVCVEQGLSCVPYFALANGFLTGKYRSGAVIDSPRSGRASAYLDARGSEILDALGAIATAHQTTMAAVALAWLLSDPTIAAPIASARSAAQLADLLPCATLTLSAEDISLLSKL